MNSRDKNRTTDIIPPQKGKKGKQAPDIEELYKGKYSGDGKPGEGMRRRGGGFGGPGGGRGGPPGMMMPTEKAKDFKGSLKRTIKQLAPFKLSLFIVVIFCIISALIGVVSPKLQGSAINIISGKLETGYMDYTALTRQLLILGVIYIASALFSFLQGWITTGVTQKLVFSLRSDIEAKLARLPLKYFDTKTHGEILSRVTNDVDNVSNSLQQSVSTVISSVITLVGVLAMMLTISPILTLITLLLVPLYLLVTFIIAPRSQRYFVAQQAALGDINGHIEEMFTGHKIVKVFGHEAQSIEEFDGINSRYYHYSRKAQIISGLIMPFMRFIGNLGYVAMCVLGGVFVSQGRINIGDMQAFLIYVRQFNQPINNLSSIANVLQSTIASAERIFAVLDEEEELPDPANPKRIQNPQGAVHFEHIEFGYTPDNILMHDLSLDVKPGQTIAIVGPTGAGKTTLVNLLMRFYDVSSGSITIDGVDIRDMTRSDLRTTFGMVLQDTWLFGGTIMENIAYGKPGAPEEDIIAAATAARANHFIRTLSEGYGTMLNEEGANVSQGQKQLLTIARAFLADPSILILDEATSSVDTRTEILIQRAMEELMNGRTSFVIAHRLSTIRDADLILVMNNGDIIEKGTHTELMEQGGFYSDLYNSQFTGAAIEEAI